MFDIPAPPLPLDTTIVEVQVLGGDDRVANRWTVSDTLYTIERKGTGPATFNLDIEGRPRLVCSAEANRDVRVTVLLAHDAGRIDAEGGCVRIKVAGRRVMVQSFRRE